MRLGLLSASRISVGAVIEPARRIDGVEIIAVGARSLAKAESFAATHGIPRAFGSYEDLLDDDDLDAIYVSTPASLHAKWTIAALDQGRHVLCEKPFAGNAVDARRMVDVAHNTGRMLMEAFHWRFHDYATHMIEKVGRLEHPITIECEFSITAIPETDIRYQFDLGGGALMDLGCYPIHWVRTLLGEPVSVDAEMTVTVDQVDDTTRAFMAFSDGSEAHVVCSMTAPQVTRRLVATGGNGVVTADNPLAPQTGNRLAWTIDGSSGEEEVGGRSTYEAQLAAFVASAAGDSQPLVTGDDSVANIAVIDEMYRRAGLSPRP